MPGPGTDLETLALRDRLARAADAVVAGLAVALIALPVPIVHFVMVPAALLPQPGLAPPAIACRGALPTSFCWTSRRTTTEHRALVRVGPFGQLVDRAGTASC